MFFFQMHSDLPASEVLASHMASAERARKEEETEEAGGGSRITYPTHQAQAVSLRIK